MPDIKEKPQMQKPKAKIPAMLAPKQAAHMLASKYRRQLDQRVSGEENEREYATEQLENTASGVVSELADDLKQFKRRQSMQIKERPVSGAGEAARDTGQATPAGQSMAPKQQAAKMQDRRNVPKERVSTPAQSNMPKERTVMEARRRAQLKGRIESVKAQKQLSQKRGIPRTDVQEGHTAGQGISSNQRRDQLNKRHSQVVSNSRQTVGQVPAAPSFQRSPKTYRAGTLKERGHSSAATLKSKWNVTASAQQRGKVAAKVRPQATQAAAKQLTRRTRQQAQQQMSHRMISRAQKAAKLTFTWMKRATVAILKAAAALANSLGGIVCAGLLLVVLVMVVVIAAVANSPFGLFFAAERNAPGTMSVAEAVAMVNVEYNARLEELQSGNYDSIVIHGQAPDWAHVLAVFAVKIAGADLDGIDVATLDADRVAKLKTVFWDMTIITTEVVTIYHPGDPGWTEYILHIYINPKSADDMRTEYHFTQYQNTALDELLADQAALAQLAGSLTITNPDTSGVLDALPAELSPERRETVRMALSLVGKVNYFWGGKSYTTGWDSRWGTLQKVTASGSSSSGTYRPFGLDCTGYLDWCFRNAGLRPGGNYYIGTNLTKISTAQAQPGDVALFPDDSHVGFVVGRTASGSLLIAHCSSGKNNVVVTEYSVTGFTKLGRPNVFD